MLSQWKKILRTNLRNINDLISFLNLTIDERKNLLSHPPFPLNLPRRLAEKIKAPYQSDPIFRQFVPIHEENTDKEGFSSNPLREDAFLKTPKLLQKYHSRALMVTNSACAMHCRYCFRREFPYETGPVSLDRECKVIAEDPTIIEVILSGGDPLTLDNKHLSLLFEKLEQIRHVKIIRFHSRFVIGIPERIDEGFLSLLKKSSKQIIFVVHINHPNELDRDIIDALKKLQNLRIPILCQSVLLKGINDNLSALKTLLIELITNGIIPYYLFQLDRVKGSSHFEVDEKKGLELVDALRKELPGYALFKYAKEEPGKGSKTEITSCQPS
jgi:lysine 2,3-aminomutase